MRARLVRLRDEGFVDLTAAHGGQERLASTTPRAARVLGRRWSRALHVGRYRAHELAVAEFVVWTELRERAPSVLTERECRRHETHSHDTFSIPVSGAERRRHWPDLVLTSNRRRLAVEVELTPKGADRLMGILRAYAISDYAQVLYLSSAHAVRERVATLAGRAIMDVPPVARDGLTPIEVRAWPRT